MAYIIAKPFTWNLGMRIALENWIRPADYHRVCSCQIYTAFTTFPTTRLSLIRLRPILTLYTFSIIPYVVVLCAIPYCCTQYVYSTHRDLLFDSSILPGKFFRGGSFCGAGLE